MLWLCLPTSLCAGAAPPDPVNPDPVRLYSTPSEQREAGLKHQLTPWLTAGGLAQLEWNYARTGYSGYQLWTSDDFEVTAEFVGATRSFRRLQADRNQPVAWNIEFVNFFNPYFDWAMRLEESKELEDEPQLRYGVPVCFRAGRYGSLTFDYLHGCYKHSFSTGANDNFLSNDNQFAAELSLAF
jgi:hypothetical protein